MDAPVAARKTNRRPLVLVVEDEALIRMVTVDWLRDCGIDCLEAADADAAMSLLQSDGNIALVFSDVRMPGQMDGVDLARWLREHRPHIPVILTSANALPSSADFAATLPFFRKPYDLSAVAARVKELAPWSAAMHRVALR